MKKTLKALLYCGIAKPYLFNNKAYKTYMEEQGIDEPSFITTNDIQYGFVKDLLNGTIVAECDIEIDSIGNSSIDIQRQYYNGDIFNEEELLKHGCLSFEELDSYLQGKNGYALRISNLKVLDKPELLDEYWKYDSEDLPCKISKAPQNICKIHKNNFMNSQEYVLIPIQSTHLVNILNETKSIVIKKRISNYMKSFVN